MTMTTMMRNDDYGDDDDDDDVICTFQFVGDVLTIRSETAVLRTTATDAGGNTAECAIDLCSVGGN